MRHLAFVSQALPIFAALLTSAVYAILHRGMIELTADGWAYWEGAVSLLEGKGYRYFSGLELDDWPPLYSLYLAGWIWGFGASGQSLLLSNSALAAIQAAGWFSFGRRLTGVSASTFSWRAVAAAAYLALFIPLWERPALAHNLLYAILPFQALATIAVIRAEGRGFGALFALILSSSLLAVTHNSGLVFAAASALAIILLTARSLAARTLLAELAAVVPAGVWYGVRVLLHQEDSHPFGTGRYSFSEYLGQGIEGAGNLFMPPPVQYAGAILLAVLAAWAAYSLRNNYRVALFLLIMTAVPFLLLLAVFNITWVSDPLSDARFSLFIPLMIVPAGFLMATPRAAGATLAAITLPMLAIRLGNAAFFAPQPVFPNAVQANYVMSWVLSPGHIVRSKQGEVLFGPPIFEWETQAENEAMSKDE